MIHNVLAPNVGESISEVSILKWAKKDGDYVHVGEVLVEIESDKATVEVVAEASGRLTHLKAASEKVPVGSVIASIDDSIKENASTKSTKSTSSSIGASLDGALPASASSQGIALVGITPNLGASTAPGTASLSPSSGARLKKEDILREILSGKTSEGEAFLGAPLKTLAPTAKVDRPGDRRVPMSMIRTKIAERLVQAQRTAAILTTFNEVDLSEVIAIRNKEKDAFKSKHGVALSFMSFFSLAVIEALKQIPEVNASIDDKDIVYHDYVDLGIAVSTDRGLVVPVVRGAEKMSLIEIEKGIASVAQKARENKLTVSEMTGGTFTISNGGTFGSLLSTPILNYPQTGILGMHKIQERPVVVNGKIEIRPMMYLALSYDHRLIDGKQAVTFLVMIKEALENPNEKLKLQF